MNDITPPKRPSQPSEPVLPQPVAINLTPPTAPIPEPLSTKPKRSRTKWLVRIIVAIVALCVLAGIGAFVWYEQGLRPVDSHDTTKQRVEIRQGMTAHSVADLLKQKRLIRSAAAFYAYVYFHGQRNHIEAGTYSVAPSDTTPQVVDQLVSGKVEQFSVTFYPGSTLTDIRTNTATKPSDVTSMLEQAGYSKDSIAAALAQDYSSPLFTSKPSGTSLIGYVYGDTYSFDVTATPSAILERTFKELDDVVVQNNLVALYKKQGLDLYQGITLASIIQREVASSSDKKATTDQAIVAQIFLARLKDHTLLGSDVTYQYAAAEMGVAPSPDLDSPYNTRKYAGLPPGPISNPGLGALLAVAHPANTDYLYFLSGDDGKTYFAHTEAEHQANIAAHCQKKCATN